VVPWFGMVHAFHGCELDEQLFQLRRRGRVVKLEPKAFDVLLHLLRHRERVVSKDELLRAVWPDAVVSESVLPSCIAAARRAVGDQRSRSKVIQTVHGRGYRFVAELREPPGEAAHPPPAAGAAAGSPFVGREHAMERLRLGLDMALAGRGRLLLLVGEPGIGKTRTADEFAEAARGRGARTLCGRCYEGEGAPAFWPWIRLLRECVRAADRATLIADMGPGAVEIAALLPELRERLGELPELRAGDDDQARFRLFDSVTTFLRRTSARRPLVLVLDDLHWADEASLQLLRFLAMELADARLLVIGTYRDVEVHRGRPLAEVLGALAREPACERVALRGLGAEEAARFVAVLLGAPPPPQLASSVWEMTEGNPFFIQETVRLLASRGAVDAFDVGDAHALALPQSVRDAIGRRLDGLSEACNGLLRVAAVLGREFRAALLERTADLPRDRVLGLLDEAGAAGIVVPAPEGPEGVGLYAFHHALIRQSLYYELDTLERVRLHRRAGEALEEACGAHPDPHLAELAHHFFQAAAGGEARKAVDYAELAAERAQRLLAWEQAARLYERALQALELSTPRDETRRCELLLAHAEARRISGERDRARSGFLAAADVARRLGRSDLLARASLGCRVYEMGAPADDATRALLEEALGALAGEHPALRSRILSRLVGVPQVASSMERRQALSCEAHALAVREGDPAALRDAFFARRWACVGPDRIEERFVIADELFELAERLGDPSFAAAGHDLRHGAHLLRGEIEAADRALSAYARLAEEIREPIFLFVARVWQGSRALAWGAFDEAERRMREAYARGSRCFPYAHFVFAGQMYILRSERGEPAGDEQEVFLGEMMELPYSWVPAIRSGLAVNHVFAGDEELGRRELEDLARDDFRDLPRDEHWLGTIGTLGGVVSALGDASRAERIHRLLSPYADLVMVHDILRQSMGSVAMVLGNLATLMGCYEEAAHHFEHAIAVEAGMDAPLAVLTSKASYARLLRLRAGHDDCARAQALVDEVESGQRAFGVQGNTRLRHLLNQVAAAGS
jgi:DNA-binding winged helix-turn-helix (wHTH) protein